MATDATGAPTPLGVPKYNTSADAPSGLGFNAAMDAIDALIAARVGKPSGISTGEAPVWNGSSWDRSSVTKLGLASLTDPGSGKVIGSLGSGAVAVTPPGTELAYAEFTGTVTANNVAEASATQIVSAGSVTFDGSTAVVVEFFAPALAPGGTLTGGINLWDGATDLGRLFDAVTVPLTADVPGAIMRRKLTPSAGAHTFSARVWTSTVSNFNVLAGAGGVGTKLPGYIRIVRA